MYLHSFIGKQFTIYWDTVYKRVMGLNLRGHCCYGQSQALLMIWWQVCNANYSIKCGLQHIHTSMYNRHQIYLTQYTPMISNDHILGVSNRSPKKSQEPLKRNKSWRRNELQPILIPEGVAMLVSISPVFFYLKHKNVKALRHGPQPGISTPRLSS